MTCFLIQCLRAAVESRRGSFRFRQPEASHPPLRRTAPIRTRILQRGRPICIGSCCLFALFAGVGHARAENANSADNAVYQIVDDFENPAAWLKGDPRTDLEQRDAAVMPDTRIVFQGKRSLLFKIRVNWKKRPGERYAKGWPMISRMFPAPQDWSEWDFLCVRIYPETSLSLSQERVLRIGLVPADAPPKHDLKWYTIPDLRPNIWNEVRIPLDDLLDPGARVKGIRFYVAEAWYHDGDRIDFHIDDMRLERLTRPCILRHDLCSRTHPRGTAVRLVLAVAGPIIKGSRVRLVIHTNGANLPPVEASHPLHAKRAVLVLPTPGLPAGHHRVRIELLTPDGKVADSSMDAFRSLAPGKAPYINLVTFYTKPLADCHIEALSRLNESAYNGVAIPLRGAYDTTPIPAFSTLQPRLDAVRKALRIDPWPWTNLNRMIGASPKGRAHAGAPTSRAYFRAIRGMDLDNETGARRDFLTLFRYAVRAARRWKSPGIVFDPEAYNDYRAYHVAYLAEVRRESPEKIIEKCRRLGADMARIVAEEYPACIIWTLFTRLERNDRLPGSNEQVLTTPSYIFLGLLDYARSHDVPLILLDGGETLPGYCDRDVDSLLEKIADRDRLMKEWLDKYSERLMLAGTISPFHDWSLARDWIRRGYEKSDIRTLEDFVPLFRVLFTAYDYVWIYASSAAKTEPYAPENIRRYGDALRRAVRMAGAPGSAP